MLVGGEKETKDNLISGRSHGGKDYGKMKVEDFVKIIKENIKI